jgi:hypothetical protein
MKAYVAVEVQLHPSLTSALDTSLTDSFVDGKRGTPYIRQEDVWASEPF